jgi:hypothetical protein
MTEEEIAAWRAEIDLTTNTAGSFFTLHQKMWHLRKDNYNDFIVLVQYALKVYNEKP